MAEMLGCKRGGAGKDALPLHNPTHNIKGDRPCTILVFCTYPSESGDSMTCVLLDGSCAVISTVVVDLACPHHRITCGRAQNGCSSSEATSPATADAFAALPSDSTTTWARAWVAASSLPSPVRISLAAARALWTLHSAYLASGQGKPSTKKKKGRPLG
jgi:hypothetical protein